jgi:hypothetical protein
MQVVGGSSVAVSPGAPRQPEERRDVSNAAVHKTEEWSPPVCGAHRMVYLVVGASETTTTVTGNHPVIGSMIEARVVTNSVCLR